MKSEGNQPCDFRCDRRHAVHRLPAGSLHRPLEVHGVAAATVESTHTSHNLIIAAALLQIHVLTFARRSLFAFCVRPRS